MDRQGFIYCFIFLLGNLNSGWTQLFPLLEDEELREEVIEEFKPNFVELYTEARVILYTEIYNQRDSVEALYSGHKRHLPPTVMSPIQYLFSNDDPDGINTEHIYPRSKGASEINGNAFSDMHNLAPARVEVNMARSNFPFAEISDSDTDFWYYKDMKLTDTSNLSTDRKSMYSEVDIIDSYFEGFFEPRESVKGDIARSMFYFYTMYREEADRADPVYFSSMQHDLCKWHAEDPVDSLETERNELKSKYQDGKVNPFILDCSLANRLFCPDNPPECPHLLTNTEHSGDPEHILKPILKVIPNPNSTIFKIDISNITPAMYLLKVHDIRGRLVFSTEEKLDYFNTINVWNNTAGTYFLHLINLENGRKFSTSFQTIL